MPHLLALEQKENERKNSIRFLEQELSALEQDRTHALEQKRRAENSLSQSRLNRGFVSLIDLQKLPDSTADAALFPVRKFQQAFHAPVKALLLPFHFQQYGKA